MELLRKVRCYLDFLFIIKQWWIQDFPERRRQPNIWSFSPKLHENEIHVNQIERMRVHPLRPRIRQCKSSAEIISSLLITEIKLR